MEQSKRVGPTWYRVTVPDTLQKKGKGYSFTPKFTVIYASSKDVAAALDTLLHINIDNTFEGTPVVSSEKDKSLVIKLRLSSNNYQSKQQKGWTEPSTL